MNSTTKINSLENDNSQALQLKSLPKIELHRHLEGALRFSTLLELAPKLGIDVPTNRLDCMDKFLVVQPMRDLGTVLNKFWMTQAVLNSPEILSRITFEAIEDAHNEGIRILELRYSPTFIRKNHENLSWQQIHEAILRGVAMAAHLPIAVGLLITIQRILPVEEGLEVCEFAISNRDSIVGMDLADDEDSGLAAMFAPVFEKARTAGMPITIHAGESRSATAPQNVIDAIEILGATRIGHGLQIINSAAAIDCVVKNRVVLEICPTSNWLTNAIPSLLSHPIRQLIEKNVLVTINSDDPGIFGISLTNEYQLLKKSYAFTEAEFNLANDIAAQASFIDLAKKQKYWERPIHKI